LSLEQNDPLGRVTTNWIWPVVEGNWAVLAKKNVWATYSDKARAKVRKGDQIVF